MKLFCRRGELVIYLKLITLFFIISTNVFSSEGKFSFCRDRQDQYFYQNELKKITSRLTFSNRGGLGKSGVCWWHNRFQRNAVYLTYFRPDLPKPSLKEAKKIIKAIRKANQIVLIPGYKDFYSFSSDFYEEILGTLEKWLVKETFVNQSWVRGSIGKTTQDAVTMESLMDELYQLVNRGEVVYQKLQLKGIEAHSWLVIGMTRNADGYDLSVIDSNFPTITTEFQYYRGDTYLSYFEDSRVFVPYTEFRKENLKLNQIVKNFCK